jgi:hypothetical protein
MWTGKAIQNVFESRQKPQVETGRAKSRAAASNISDPWPAITPLAEPTIRQNHEDDEE